MSPGDTRLLYTALVGLVGLERLVELAISRRHLRRALARGGVVEGPASRRRSVAFHVTFLAACPLEAWGLDRPWRPALGFAMLTVLAITMALRYWAVGTLGERWNIWVVCVPGDATVTGGPYRWLRHPNYLAVLFEVPALALVHGAWFTAAAFGIGDVLLLAQRIRLEEGLLCRHTDYDRTMADRSRLLPRFR